MGTINYQMVDLWYCQWPFQEPKMEVPTIYKAYVSEYHHKIWPYMVQYLHFRILEISHWYWVSHKIRGATRHTRHGPKNAASSGTILQFRSSDGPQGNGMMIELNNDHPEDLIVLNDH